MFFSSENQKRRKNGLKIFKKHLREQFYANLFLRNLFVENILSVKTSRIIKHLFLSDLSE